MPDPVADLTAGCRRMRFADQNPALYQLMFGLRRWLGALARRRVFDLLEATLVRCAAAGGLQLEPGIAAQLILSAKVGVALNQIAQPELCDDVGSRTRCATPCSATYPSNPQNRTPRHPARSSPAPHSQLALTGTALRLVLGSPSQVPTHSSQQNRPSWIGGCSASTKTTTEHCPRLRRTPGRRALHCSTTIGSRTSSCPTGS